VTQLNDLDYEAIENAVLETARGRWFLSEYKKRNGVAGTQTLLDAIGRLEKVISSINPNTAPAPAKPAKPAAEPVVAAVAAMPEKTTKPKVAVKPEPAKVEIKDQMAEKAPTAPAPVLTDNNLQFFSNDEDLFADDANALLPDPIQTETVELTSAAKPAEKPEAAAKPEQTTEKPAKNNPSRVKIVRTNTKSDDEKPVEKQASNNSTTAPDPVMTPTVEEQDRIVIIRKSASNDVEIPLADGLSLDNGANSAAKPV
jgi:hypothetical protein